MRCRICGAEVSGGPFLWWRGPHYRSSHAEYAKWFFRWARNFYLLALSFILGIVIAQYLWFTYGGVYEVVAGLVIVLFLVFCFYEIEYLLRRGLRRYQRQWRDQHAPSGLPLASP